MKSWTLFLLLIALSASGCGGTAVPSPTAAPSATAGGSAASNQPKPEKAKVSIARSAPGGTFIPIMIAKEAGYFANHGLDAELLMVAPPAANQAMVSGSLDIYEGATSVVTAILGGADFVYVAAPVDRNALQLIVKPGTTNFRGLKDKTIATTSAGAFGDIAARYTGKREGMEAGKDFKLLYFPAGEAALAAFDSGQSDGLLLTPPYATVAANKGNPIIVDYLKEGLRMIGPGTAVTRTFLRQNPNTIRAFLIAYLEGLKRAIDDPTYAKQLDQKYAKFDDPSLVDPDYDRALEVWNKNLVVVPESIQVVLDTSTDPKARTAKASDFYDNSIIEQVNRDVGSKLFPDAIK